MGDINFSPHKSLLQMAEISYWVSGKAIQPIQALTHSCVRGSVPSSSFLPFWLIRAQLADDRTAGPPFT